MNTVVVSDLQDRLEIFFGEISVSATKMVGVFIFFLCQCSLGLKSGQQYMNAFKAMYWHGK